MVTKHAQDQEWEQPLISIDTVALQYNKREKAIKVLLGRRKYEPFINELSLPGVLLLPSERVLEASARSLSSKVHVEDANSIQFMQDIGVSDNPDRDPRGATLSIVVLAMLNGDYAVDNEDMIVEWLNVENLNNVDLPFDHNNLILKTLIELEKSFFVDVPLTKAILGDGFTTSDVGVIYKTLAQLTNSGIKELNSTNLARKIRLSGLVKEEAKVEKSSPTPANKALFGDSSTELKVVPRFRGRPPVTWAWV